MRETLKATICLFAEQQSAKGSVTACSMFPFLRQVRSMESDTTESERTAIARPLIARSFAHARPVFAAQVRFSCPDVPEQMRPQTTGDAGRAGGRHLLSLPARAGQHGGVLQKADKLPPPPSLRKRRRYSVASEARRGRQHHFRGQRPPPFGTGVHRPRSSCNGGLIDPPTLPIAFAHG